MNGIAINYKCAHGIKEFAVRQLNIKTLGMSTLGFGLTMRNSRFKVPVRLGSELGSKVIR